MYTAESRPLGPPGSPALTLTNTEYICYIIYTVYIYTGERIRAFRSLRVTEARDETVLAQAFRLNLAKRSMQWALQRARGACSSTILCHAQFATAAADIGEIGIISGAPDDTFKRKVVFMHVMLRA